MYALGEMQELVLKRITKSGAYLGEKGDQGRNDILLPGSELSPEDKIGQSLLVFVYKDHQNRYIATKKQPKITIGEVRALEVRDITPIGAFLDWGLEKELLLPFQEQLGKLEKGRFYLVALYVDKSNRLCATMKIRDYLTSNSPYTENDWVNGIVYSIHPDYGAFVAVDNQYDAMIDKKDMVGVIAIGESIRARVSSKRPDGRLNLVLKDKAHLTINQDAEKVYQIIRNNQGFVLVNDKSDPEVIRQIFNMSKSSFKRAVGGLLKHKKIVFYKDGIKIIK